MFVKNEKINIHKISILPLKTPFCRSQNAELTPSKRRYNMVEMAF